MTILAREAQIWPQFFSKKLENFAKKSSKAPVFDENPLTSTHFSLQFIRSQAPSSETRIALTRKKKKKKKKKKRPRAKMTQNPRQKTDKKSLYL